MKKEIDCHEFARTNAMLASKSRNDSPKSAPKLAPKLAIVVPCYNEEAVVAHTYNALCQKLDLLIKQKAISKESFLCFVDDGSKDKTCELLLSLKNHHTDKFCHTERSEVSIKLKRALNSMDFSLCAYARRSK